MQCISIFAFWQYVVYILIFAYINFRESQKLNISPDHILVVPPIFVNFACINFANDTGNNCETTFYTHEDQNNRQNNESFLWNFCRNIRDHFHLKI